MRTMVRLEEQSLLVEAKAVDALYPLYGALDLAPPLGLAALQTTTDAQGNVLYGALAEQTLFDRIRSGAGSDCWTGANSPSTQCRGDGGTGPHSWWISL